MLLRIFKTANYALLLSLLNIGCAQSLETRIDQIRYASDVSEITARAVAEREGDHLIIISVGVEYGMICVFDRYVVDGCVVCDSLTCSMLRGGGVRYYGETAESDGWTREYAVCDERAVQTFRNLYQLAAHCDSCCKDDEFYEAYTSFSILTTGEKERTVIYDGPDVTWLLDQMAHWRGFLAKGRVPGDADCAVELFESNLFLCPAEYVVVAIDCFDDLCRVANLAKSSEGQVEGSEGES